MKTKEIRDLIDFISQSGLQEVNIETEELKLSVKRTADAKIQVADNPPAPAPSSAAPAPPPAAAAPEAKAAPENSPENDQYVTIKSPMIGTFYRASSPDIDPYVKIGDKIEPGQVVCIVEAMKLFNEIESEISGTVVKILVENASPVEYDQPLLLIDPS